MDLGLSGRRALVTGSTSGNGRAIATSLAAEGARVMVHGADWPGEEENLAYVLEEIRRTGAEAHGYLADLSSDEGAERLGAAAKSQLGSVDILVNNAGVYPERTWWDATSDDWLERYSTNVVSMVRLIRLIVPGMREAGWGRVINLSSGLAWQPIAQVPDYSATKAAVTNLTVSLAKELDRTGITVNSISPGVILTPGIKSFYANLAAELGWGDTWEEIETSILREVLDNPAGRLGRAEDVAYVATMLASPRAEYLNGANFRVDGGSTITIN